MLGAIEAGALCEDGYEFLFGKAIVEDLQQKAIEKQREIDAKVVE